MNEQQKELSLQTNAVKGEKIIAVIFNVQVLKMLVNAVVNKLMSIVILRLKKALKILVKGKNI